MNLSNLSLRVLTGSIGGAIVLGAIVYNPISFALLVIALQCLTLWEFYGLVQTVGLHPHKILGMIGGGLLIFYPLSTIADYGMQINLTSTYTIQLILILCGILSHLMLAISLWKTVEKPLESIAVSVLGWWYIALPYAILLGLPYLVKAPEGISFNYPIILSCLFLIWANDIGAYFVGKSFGKHKLFERISPKKTWEGSIGGALTTAGISIVLFYTWGMLSLAEWVGLSILITISGSVGDLVESMLKRYLGVKDSGTLLPGHGGFLDRFDALIFALPWIFIYLLLIASS
ncbi:MAG: phosphatidate cytidylyltransferase [Cytophagaceae bacterium]|jgi:phosphatidate cytidylyltransferase|nr:phosphatidate cytidylyltransferase [Cytophagaceae bacterium]